MSGVYSQADCPSNWRINKQSYDSEAPLPQRRFRKTRHSVPGSHAGTISVVCVNSGTNALRAALKTVLADGRSMARNSIIMPAVTAVSIADP